jgi:SnoaL-like protein
MPGHPTPVDVAIAFTQAWTSHDMTGAARYVAQHVAFEGPMTQAAGVQAYIEGLTRFAQTVTGLKILAALGDDQRAMIMYDVITVPFGTLRAAEHLVIRDGKITHDRLVFDTHEIRKARDAHASSA